MITVCTLGPGPVSFLTLETDRELHSGKRIVFRTQRHPVAERLLGEGLAIESFDSLYDQFEDYDLLYEEMARRLMASPADTVYAVPDPSTDASVIRLLSLGADMRILPGTSLSSCCLSRLPSGTVLSSHLLTCSATSFTGPRPEGSCLITELYSQALAGDLKLRLTDCYPDDFQAVLLSWHRDDLKAETIPLYTLDRQKHYDHLTCLYLPPLPFASRTRFSVGDLVHVMSVLRAPDGCPWDRIQTHQTLRPYLIEEAYEAAGAIDEKDMDHLCDELGDVLLQVIFHASIGEASGDFNLTDVSTAICRKMMHRHPFLFGGSAPDASCDWEELKREERSLTTLSEQLRDVTPALPALMRAQKVLSRTEKAGVPLPSAADLAGSLKAWAGSGDALSDAGELGRALLTLSALARSRGLDAEQALASATEDLIGSLEEAGKTDGSLRKPFNCLTKDEMHVYCASVLRGVLTHTSSGTSKSPEHNYHPKADETE